MGIKSRSIPMDFQYIQLGTDIRAAMVELNLTAQDVATLCGYSDTLVSSLASHNNPNPHINTFLAVCNALDLDPRKYFGLRG